MSNQNTQVCPICGVKIVKMLGKDQVIFSAGPPGDRNRLWTRVCQYTDKPGCINKNHGSKTEDNSPPIQSTLFK